ncbi:Bacterial membrane protein YfhO [compost metagenome]
MWNPFTGIGTPFFADVQQTSLSLSNIIYLLFGTALGANIFHILQLSLAGFFMYLYINEVLRKRYVGIIVGVIFAFSSMIGGGRIEHTTIITTIVFFPLILFFLERYKSTKREKYIVFSSIAMAIHFLSGFTQIVLYYDIVFFVYFIYICYQLKYSIRTILVKLFKWVLPYLLLIAVQLLPTLQLMRQSGRGEVSFEFFSLLSYDLRILLMMLFPYGYLDNIEPLGAYASSGIDIEIYIGIIPVIYLMYSMIFHFKDKFIQLISGIMVFAFFYGMAPNIPYISKVVYSIPIIGSFRVSARMLSVFLICGLILFGYTLSKLNDKIEIKRLIKFSGLFTIIILFCAFVLISAFSQSAIPPEISSHYTWNSGVFLPVIYLCCVNLVGLVILYFANSKKYASYLIIGLICVITVVDVGKYSILNNTNSSKDALRDNNPQNVQSLISNTPFYRSFALLQSPEQYYDNQINIAKIQRNLLSESMFYNSYITFIDQKLNNFNIAETVVYPSTVNSLDSRNDLISMMSIRYILDAWNQGVSSSIVTDEVEKQILSESELILLNNESQLSVKAYPVTLEPNSAYKVDITMSVSDSPQLFYVDFYSDTYDDPKQDGTFGNFSSEISEYTTVIQTGDEVPSDGVNFRIISQSATDINIKKITIDKLKVTKDTYQKVLSEDGIDVYENTNAKPILFVPKYVKSVDSYNLLYDNERIERLDENSFIKDFNHDMDLTRVNSEITNIVQKYNSISAVITSDDDTFINHSQLSYPGWKAYVDGVQVPIYNVNNLIQGTEVPAGTHQISFVFDPEDVKIGAILSLSGVVLCLYYLYYESIRTWLKRKKGDV